MLDAFKIKPFDLEPIYAQWTDGPIFSGNPKKDLPVDEWLDQIKAGSIERGVPEEYWYKVAQHFMGPKARARLNELKQIIVKVHGGKYRWTWKKFRVAMQNMGWGIDKDATETIKVQGKSSGLWFMRKKDKEDDKIAPATADESPERTPPTRSNSMFWGINKKPLVEEPCGSEQFEVVSRPSMRDRATTVDASSSTSFWPNRRLSVSRSKEELRERPGHQKSKSTSAVVTTTSRSNVSRPTTPPRSQTTDGNEVAVTTIANAPVWLLNACTALDYITSEHPKAMSVLSAILITAGSLPAIPAISAGAGGAVLASGAAHAIGAIAIGLGQALGASIKNSQAQLQTQAQAPAGH